MFAGRASALEKIPLAASRVGYTMETFSTREFSGDVVDTRRQREGRYQWYGWNFFGYDIYKSIGSVKINADGSVTIGGGTIASAMHLGQYPHFKGVAFGGGAYFEAELKFDPSKANGQKRWPSWWGMSIEHLAQMPPPFGRWPGRGESFEHFGEIDFFEYDRSYIKHPEQYGATLHDWYGEYNTKCRSYCSIDTSYAESTIDAPVGVDWNEYHKLGALWVPAANSSPGYVTFYFDGVPKKTFEWRPGEGNPHSINDRNHLAIMLGSSAAAPITVRSVRVWQKSSILNWYE